MLNISDVKNVAAVTKLTDKANGYVYKSGEMSEMIAKAEAEFDVAQAFEMYRKKDTV